MEERIFPRWFCTLLSYLSAFTLGIYAYSTKQGVAIEEYRWALTALFGIMFFGMSRSK